jgi:DNA-binding NtrC family response regulator
VKEATIFTCYSASFASILPKGMKMVPVKLTDEARLLVLKYPWPGNVRQLKNVAEQVSILSVDKDISAQELDPDSTRYYSE